MVYQRLLKSPLCFLSFIVPCSDFRYTISVRPPSGHRATKCPLSPDLDGKARWQRMLVELFWAWSMYRNPWWKGQTRDAGCSKGLIVLSQDDRLQRACETQAQTTAKQMIVTPPPRSACTWPPVHGPRCACHYATPNAPLPASKWAEEAALAISAMNSCWRMRM